MNWIRHATAWGLVAAVTAAPLLCCCLLLEAAASPAVMTAEVQNCHSHPGQEEQAPNPGQKSDCDCHDKLWKGGVDNGATWVLAELSPQPVVSLPTLLSIAAPRPPMVETLLRSRAPPLLTGRDRCILHAVHLI